MGNVGSAAAATAAPEGPTAQVALADRLDELERQRSADVESRLLGARRVEAEARAAGLDVETMRARLVAADMLHRVGDGAQAAQLAVEVNAWASAQGPRSLQARSHLVLSSVFEGIGDTASTLDHAVRAYELLDAAAAPALERGIYLQRLADASALVGSADEARRRYAEAEAAFADVGDPERLLTVLNNLAVLEYETGNTTAALAAAQRLAQFCGPDGMHPSYAETIARAHLGAGDLEAAETMVELGLEIWRGRGDAQAVTPAELALTHVEILMAQDRLDEATTHLDHCFQVCAERDLRGIRVQAMKVQAALFAARGDHAGAYEAHRAFHEEFLTVRSHQQEAAARTRQALAQTAEARAEAQQFWHQARTDPLTELVNRRFVDEELPRLLKDAVHRGEPLVAAIVDVDHFKAINDRFSHDVGDQVLRHLAATMAAAARDRGFAARLGGEEFLFVQVGVPTAEAVSRLEELRLTVAARDWQDVDPALAVTISTGVAVAEETDTQLTLLARADARLYRAKQTGRNRIVTG